MSVLVGKKAPEFFADAVINGNEIVDNFSLNQYLGEKHVLLFFYPKDFTAVCPTELLAFQEKLEEFKSRGVEVVACSTDTESSHYAWLHIEQEDGGIKGVTYPMVADTAKTIAANYGVLAGDYILNEENEMIATGPMIALRGLFLIDKSGIVMHEVVNFFTLGRSTDEALRMVDALQHFEEHGETCPADWRPA